MERRSWLLLISPPPSAVSHPPSHLTQSLSFCLSCCCIENLYCRCPLVPPICLPFCVFLVHSVVFPFHISCLHFTSTPPFFLPFFRLLPALPSLRLYLTLCYLLSFSTSTSLLFIFNSPLPSSLLSLNSGLFFHLRQIFSPSSHVSRRGLSHFHTLSIIWYWAVTMDL